MLAYRYFVSSVFLCSNSTDATFGEVRYLKASPLCLWVYERPLPSLQWVQTDAGFCDSGSSLRFHAQSTLLCGAARSVGRSVGGCVGAMMRSHRAVNKSDLTEIKKRDVKAESQSNNNNKKVLLVLLANTWMSSV